MFAVAIDAGAFGRLAEGGGYSRQQLAAQPLFRPRHGDAGGGGVVMRVLVAGLAGAVADRHERLLMAGFAAALQRVMCLAERAGGPALFAHHRVAVARVVRGAELARAACRVRGCTSL